MATCATATAWACVDPQRPRRAQPRLAHRRVAQRALRRVAQPRRRRALRLRLPRAQPRRRPRRLPRPRRQRAQPRLRLRRLCAYHLATPPATPTVSAAAVSAIRDSAVSSAPALRADRCSTAARPTVSAAAEFAAYSAVICADRRGTCAPLTMLLWREHLRQRQLPIPIASQIALPARAAVSAVAAPAPAAQAPSGMEGVSVLTQAAPSGS